MTPYINKIPFHVNKLPFLNNKLRRGSWYEGKFRPRALVTYMRVKLASRAQFYVKDIFGQIFKFVRNMRENKDNESFLGFVEKSKQCQTNQ